VEWIVISEQLRDTAFKKPTINDLFPTVWQTVIGEQWTVWLEEQPSVLFFTFLPKVR
jgi:hypothetical protein